MAPRLWMIPLRYATLMVPNVAAMLEHVTRTLVLSVYILMVFFSQGLFLGVVCLSEIACSKVAASEDNGIEALSSSVYVSVLLKSKSNEDGMGKTLTKTLSI